MANTKRHNPERRKFFGAAAVFATGTYLTADAITGGPVSRAVRALNQVPSYGGDARTENIESSVSKYTGKSTDLKLQLFHDSHADGKQQNDEPLIKDMPFKVKGIDVDYETTLFSESQRIYWARNIPIGKKYQLVPQVDKFRYVFLSNAEFRRLSEFAISIGSNEPSLKLGLGEGFCTTPVKKGTDYWLSNYVNVGYPSTTRDWRGLGLTYYIHRGIDWTVGEDIPIVAMAPGLVVAAEDDWTRNPDLKITGNRVIIDHFVGNTGFRTASIHLKRLNVKKRNVRLPIDNTRTDYQKVERGEIIGFAGDTGDSGGATHLHSEVNIYPPNSYVIGGEMLFGFAAGRGIDPFRDLHYDSNVRSNWGNLISLWTKDNDPQFSI